MSSVNQSLIICSSIWFIRVIRLQCGNIAFRHLNSEPLKLAWDNCADALLDEDKQFLNDIPHYENTLAKMDQVVEVASICMYMKHKSAHITAKITAIAEQQAMAVKKEIIKHAESYYV
jgi:hypothetical protein